MICGSFEVSAGPRTTDSNSMGHELNVLMRDYRGGTQKNF